MMEEQTEDNVGGEVTTEARASETNYSDPTQFLHTPYYCEENVYFLCKKLCEDGIAEADGSDLFVVFISNEKKQIPLWHQKASTRADGIVLWDYHVICIQRKRGGDSDFPPLVWDLDSTLAFPCSLALYVNETIQPSFQLFSEYQRLFRIVHAPVFLRYFASDRRHMKDPVGDWIAQPPAYEAIVSEDGTKHNLNEYMEIRASDESTDITANIVSSAFSRRLGIVINPNRLKEFFSQIS